MGRPSRIVFPGACYLVGLRGNNRQDLFLSNQDRRKFLDLMRAVRDRYGLTVYAYCLTHGRADLLVRTERANLSAAMQAFATAYARYFSAAHNTVGHVLRGRYQAWLVDPDGGLAEASRWAHLACVRERLSAKPWRFEWSSCAAYVTADTRESLVDSRAVLVKFGGVRLKQSVRYLQFMKERMQSSGAPVLRLAGGVAFGSAEFRAKIAQIPSGPAPRRPDASERARLILEDVAAARGVSVEHLLGRPRWREIASVRREVVHRLWREAGMSVTELARLFGRTAGAISQMVRALEEPGPSANNK